MGSCLITRTMFKSCLFILLTLISNGYALKVLWIGNSYTYYNDLPKLVGEIANQTGHEYIYDSHLEGGWTWERHAQSQETLDKITSDMWDVVILQEYSTRPAYDEKIVCNQTVPYLDQLVKAIRDNNPATLLQFYLTWGRPYGELQLCQTMQQFCSYETMQDALTSRYTSFACMKRPARAAPVGEAFRAMKLFDWDLEDEYFHSLYVEGDHHPSMRGSYLAALLHFMSLYNVPVVSNDPSIPYLGVDPFFAKLLMLAAEETFNSQSWEFIGESACDQSLCQHPYHV